MQVTGSLSNPELKGSISIQGGGSLKLGRARVQISEGRLILNNYPESQLELDIGGITRISGVFIELRVQGQLDNLQTQLQAPILSIQSPMIISATALSSHSATHSKRSIWKLSGTEISSDFAD